MRKFKGLVCVAAVAAIMTFAGGCTFTIGGNTNYTYSDSDKYMSGDREVTEKIDKIEVDYISGDVKIVMANTDKITIKETAKKTLKDDQKVHTWVDGSTLHIKYCESSKKINLNNLNKTLEITVPEDVVYDKINFDMASGDVDVSCAADRFEMDTASGSITLKQTGESEEIDLNSASGSINLEFENADDIDIDTASGDIESNGDKVSTYKADSVSGKNEVHLKQAPDKIDMSSTSGDIKIYLPKDAGISAEFDTVSGDISYDLGLEKKGDKYICGNEKCKMKIDSVSGDLKIGTE